MPRARERYLTDDEGHRIAVVLDVDEYERLRDALDELEAIRAFDAAQTSGERPVPFDEAVARIESGGR
jgi:PHD/YefM family antitoxin component YafN of YafNO toxin-antitoxin module